MINNPLAPGYAARPRGMVFANGERLAGVHSFQVDNNTFFQADTFRLSLAMSAQPAARAFDWWAQQEKLELEFLIGFPSDPNSFQKVELTSFLVGYADDLEFDPVADVMTLTGRDLTSKLIDFKQTLFSKTVRGQKASDIVTQIAVAQGLTPVVTATTAATGGYYQIVNALIASNATYWDIVTRLAQLEGFQTYVKGHELRFEPRTDPAADPYVIQWRPPADQTASPAVNVQRLQFRRNLSVAKDLRVRVLSFDQKTKKTVNEVADRKRVRSRTSKATPYDGPPQEYVRTFPNLTAAQAQAKAQALLVELSKHEMNLTADLPGDLLLSATNMVKVIGTGTAFDQTYFASSVVRTFSFDEGFRMALTAKNQTPNNAV